MEEPPYTEIKNGGAMEGYCVCVWARLPTLYFIQKKATHCWNN